jgi:hypothetical protein
LKRDAEEIPLIPSNRNNKKRSKGSVFKVVFIIAIVIVGFFLAWEVHTGPTTKDGMLASTPVTEKVDFNDITVNSNRISISVTALHLQDNSNWRNISITGVILKDANGEVVQASNLEESPVAIRLNSKNTINFELSTSLIESKQYTITLVSGAGGAFISPRFTA